MTNAVQMCYDDNYDVKQFISHPDYNRRSKHNDIALIELAKHFMYESLQIRLIYFGYIWIYIFSYSSSCSVPACLNQPPALGEVNVKVYGYGQTSFSGGVSEVLQTVRLKTIKNENCSKFYEEETDIISSQLCAHDSEKKGRDTWWE